MNADSLNPWGIANPNGGQGPAVGPSMVWPAPSPRNDFNPTVLDPFQNMPGNPIVNLNPHATHFNPPSHHPLPVNLNSQLGGSGAGGGQVGGQPNQNWQGKLPDYNNISGISNDP